MSDGDEICPDCGTERSLAHPDARRWAAPSPALTREALAAALPKLLYDHGFARFDLSWYDNGQPDRRFGPLADAILAALGTPPPHEHDKQFETLGVVSYCSVCGHVTVTPPPTSTREET